jgi:hypothetical protein
MLQRYNKKSCLLIAPFRQIFCVLSSGRFSTKNTIRFFSKLLFHRKRNAAYDIHDRVVEMSLRQDERCCTDVFDDTNNAHAGLARDCG